jgi:hypothetical protein
MSSRSDGVSSMIAASRGVTGIEASRLRLLARIWMRRPAGVAWM